MWKEARRAAAICLVCGAMTVLGAACGSHNGNEMTPPPTGPAPTGAPTPPDENDRTPFPPLTAVPAQREPTAIPQATRIEAPTLEVEPSASPEATAAAGGPEVPINHPGFVEAHDGKLYKDGKALQMLGVNRYQIALTDSSCGTVFPRTDRQEYFKNLKAAGYEVVRFWAFPDYDEGDMKNIKEVLDDLKAADMMGIPVAGNQWSDCKPGTTPKDSVNADGNKTPEFYTKGDKEKGATGKSFMDHLAQLAQVTAGRPEVAAIEIMNEPEGETDALGTFIDDAMKVIREYDKDHIVEPGLIGGGQPGTNEDNFGNLTRKTNAASLHDYEGEDRLKQLAKAAEQNQLTDDLVIPGDGYNGPKTNLQRVHGDKDPMPVIVGEVGVKSRCDEPDCVPEDDRIKILGAKGRAYFDAGASMVIFWSGPDNTPDNKGFDLTFDELKQLAIIARGGQQK